MQQMVQRDRVFLWPHGLWHDLCVAAIVALGVVGLEHRVEWWDQIRVQPRPLPASIHEFSKCFWNVSP